LDPGPQGRKHGQAFGAETRRVLDLPENFVLILDILLMAEFTVSLLAIPGVALLIIFLAYSSQVLFLYLEPAPLSRREVVQFNLLVFCLWICYLRACITSPGSVPQDWTPIDAVNVKEDSGDADDKHSRQRWCRKCEALKPPRAHHCKTCDRSVTAHWYT
jgi:palmitoyltransferase